MNITARGADLSWPKLRTGNRPRTIVVGLAAASYNLRMLRNWQQRTGKLAPDHPLVAAPPPDHGFVMLTEEEYAQLAARYQTDAA